MRKGLFRLHDPIGSAQHLIVQGRLQSAELGAWVKRIVNERLWRTRKDANGQYFSSFAQFATAPRPQGLGINSREEMDEFSAVLDKNQLYDAWKEVLEATTRSRGRPSKKTLALSENKIPTFKLQTSYTTRARQVVELSRKHAAIYEELCAGLISLPDAVRKAGLVKRRGSTHLRYGVLDRQGVRNLSMSAQGKLLSELFRAVTLQAQCHLLAKILGPALGQELASKWRAHERSRMSHDETP